MNNKFYKTEASKATMPPWDDQIMCPLCSSFLELVSVPSHSKCPVRLQKDSPRNMGNYFLKSYFQETYPNLKEVNLPNFNNVALTVGEIDMVFSLETGRSSTFLIPTGKRILIEKSSRIKDSEA